MSKCEHGFCWVSCIARTESVSWSCPKIPLLCVNTFNKLNCSCTFPALESHVGEYFTPENNICPRTTRNIILPLSNDSHAYLLTCNSHHYFLSLVCPFLSLSKRSADLICWEPTASVTSATSTDSALSRAPRSTLTTVLKYCCELREWDGCILWIVNTPLLL